MCSVQLNTSSHYIALVSAAAETFDHLQKSGFTSCIMLLNSDAPIWNLADIPITDNGSEISADTDSQSNMQLRSIFLPFSTQFHNFMANFPIKMSNFGYQYTFCNIANS